jgi:hypothetical protein
MVLFRLIPVLTLLFAMSNWPATRLPREPIIDQQPTGLTKPALAPASQPASITSLYLPLVTDRYISGYTPPFGTVMYHAVDNPAGLAKMLQAGSHWFSTDLYWSAVEPTPPAAGVHTYDWGSFDSDVANVQAAGGQLYVLVTRNPDWASFYPSGPVTDTQNLIDFAATLAERYDGDGYLDAPTHAVVNYWSFYAEPDNGAEWAALLGKGYWGHNPTGYAAMLKLVANAMHAANPNAKILIGGLAYDSFEDGHGGGQFVESFLAETLTALGDAAAANYIDAVAFHYYPINLDRWPSIREKGLEIRSIMQAHGVGQLELIVPEMGYWSAEANGSSQLSQARLLAQMFVKGLSINISHLDWFAPFDDGAGMETHGLFDNHSLDQPKLAYSAYATLTHTLYGLVYNRTFGVSGGEGYVFRGPDGREVTVVWGTASPSAVAHFAGGCVAKTDLLGAVSVITDGSGSDADGSANGQVGVALTQNHAVYITACS